MCEDVALPTCCHFHLLWAGWSEVMGRIGQGMVWLNEVGWGRVGYGRSCDIW